MTGLRDIDADALRILQRQGSQPIGCDVPIGTACLLAQHGLLTLDRPTQTVAITAKGRTALAQHQYERAWA